MTEPGRAQIKQAIAGFTGPDLDPSYRDAGCTDAIDIYGDRRGHAEPRFGEEDGSRMGEGYDVPLLGQLPLARAICVQPEGGEGAIIAGAASQTPIAYRSIARRGAAWVTRADELPQGSANIQIVED